MSTEKLYAEAKDEAAIGNYDKAAKLYEQLEGRAAGTLLGQQAQLERAWASTRRGDKAHRADRDRPLHQAQPEQPGARLCATTCAG